MSDSAQPGWYHAEGDPPNTERYWDGSSWTQGPRPIGGTPSPAAPSPATPSDASPLDAPLSNSPFTAPDTPAAGSTGTGVPTGGASGLDAGFPSMDDPTPAAGSYDAGPSNLPGAAPGGYGSTQPPGVPAPTTPPPGFPPGSNMGVPGQPPMPGAGFPSAPVGGHGMGFPEQSQATAALVFSSLGLFCCGFPAAIGIWLGMKEKNGMDAGRRDPSMKGQTTATFVIGGLALLLWFGAFALILLGAIAG